MKAGRYLVTVEAGDRAADARGVYTRHGGYDRSTARAATVRPAAEGGRTVQVQRGAAPGDQAAVEAGEVDVRKEVHTEHKQITVPVEREEVVIERRPAGGGAAAGGHQGRGDPHPGRRRRRSTSPRRRWSRRRCRVGKRKVQGTETVSGDVRKEELVVETEGKAKVRNTGRPDKK